MKDFADIRVHSAVTDAIVQAIRERSNLLLVGPSGTGKTAIAKPNHQRSIFLGAGTK
jgi:predicted ATPase with chaperone activity